METFEPPFRGAILIAQNDPVDASPALRERIMGIHFDKSLFSPATKAAAERLSAYELADLSGFPVHVVRREEAILKAYYAAFAKHEASMLKQPGIRNWRLAKNHAQLAAMLDAMQLVIRNLRADQVREAHDFILTMLADRQRTVETDHPHVELFWERFDYIVSREPPGPDHPIDHSRDPGVIAVNLNHFEQRLGELRLSLPCPMTDLKRLLRSSKRRKFIAAKTVNSRTDKAVHCWTFVNPDHPESNASGSNR